MKRESKNYLQTSEEMPSAKAMILIRVLRRGGLTKKRNSAKGGQV